MRPRDDEEKDPPRVWALREPFSWPIMEIVPPASAIALTPWLEHLRAHVEIARAGEDPEGPHQLRVASRRLAAWLALAGLRVLRSDLRWLRTAAGEARDLDILLARAAPPAWRSWLADRREEARAQLVAALAAPRLVGLVRALELLPAIDARVGRARLRRLARRVQARGGAVDAAPDVLPGLHSLRRAARTLRYALEWLDDDPGPLHGLQEALGRLSDPSLALRWLDAYPGGGRLAAERRRLEEEIEVCHSDAIGAWDATRGYVAELA